MRFKESRFFLKKINGVTLSNLYRTWHMLQLSLFARDSLYLLMSALGKAVHLFSFGVPLRKLLHALRVQCNAIVPPHCSSVEMASSVSCRRGEGLQVWVQEGG